jgi:hypothetical protein
MSNKTNKKYTKKFLLTKEELYFLYWIKSHSLKTIAISTHVSVQTVLRYMKKWEIQRKTYSEAGKRYFQNNPLTQQEKDRLAKLNKTKEIVLDKEYLYQHYCVLEKFAATIAKELGCSNTTVIKNLKKFNIPLRTNSENKKGNKNPSFGKRGAQSPRWNKEHTDETKEKIRNNVPRGESHKNWKNPEERIETVNGQIRTCQKMKEWKLAVLKKNNFSCVKCGKTRKDGVILNADHIVPFAKIKKQYNILSLLDAITCEALWDVNNGRTLCVECHQLTETWGGKSKKNKENN